MPCLLFAAASAVMAGDTAEMQYARSCIGRAGMAQRNMGCIELDFDRDGDTDMDDFGVFQRQGFCLTPPEQPPVIVPPPTTQPASRPAECECPCSPDAKRPGVTITWQIWEPLEPDLQADFDAFLIQFGKKLATRPAYR